MSEKILAMANPMLCAVFAVAFFVLWRRETSATWIVILAATYASRAVGFFVFHFTANPNGVAAIVTVDGGKASLAVGVTPDLVDSHSAIDLVRAGVQALGGKGGGGRPDMAQGGGPDTAAADAAIEAIAASLAG